MLWGELGLEGSGWRKVFRMLAMTEVQEKCCPYLLRKDDLCVEGALGADAALAIVVSVIENLTKRLRTNADDMTGAIVLAPSKELAVVIRNELLKFIDDFPKLNYILCISDNAVNKLKQNLHGSCAQIIVATPGCLDPILMTENNCLSGFLNVVDSLYFYGADGLFTSGFTTVLENTVKLLPVNKQTVMFFSCKQTEEMREVVKQFMISSVSIIIDEPQICVANRNDRSFYVLCAPGSKISMLLALLEKRKSSKVLLICHSFECCRYIFKLLKQLLISSKIFLVSKEFKGRHTSMKTFIKRESGICVSTDVVTRGIDMPGVEWIVFFDPPNSSSYQLRHWGKIPGNYKHNTVLLLMSHQHGYVDFIKDMHKIPLKNVSMPLEKVEDVTLIVKSLLSSDSQLAEFCHKAFIKTVWCYRNHNCPEIVASSDEQIEAIKQDFSVPDVLNVGSRQESLSTLVKPALSIGNTDALTDSKSSDDGEEQLIQSKQELVEMLNVSKTSKSADDTLISPSSSPNEEKIKEIKNNEDKDNVIYLKKIKRKLSVDDSQSHDVSSKKVKPKLKSGKNSKGIVKSKICFKKRSLVTMKRRKKIVKT